MTAEQIPEADLLESLSSGTCPACGGGKRRKETFCPRCYHSLPRGAQAATYKRLGNGYAEAVAAAMNLLGRSVFRLPVPEAFAPQGDLFSPSDAFSREARR